MGPVDPEILWLRANKSAMTQNWLPRQRPLRNWKKWTGFTIFSSHKYLPFGELIVKISPVDPEIALLNLKKRKKLTQAKYIARSAGLPSGLNYFFPDFRGNLKSMFVHVFHTPLVFPSRLTGYYGFSMQVAKTPTYPVM